MKYFHEKIEAKWQQYWAKNQTFAATNNSDKPKYYVLDMFPYPSGAGLHVGHPLGYIASDIYKFYKFRLRKIFNFFSNICNRTSWKGCKKIWFEKIFWNNGLG